MSPIKRKSIWLVVTAAVVVVALAACKPGDPGRSTGAYPIDIFQEMHYNQSYKAQEPPRISAPSDSIPVSGGFIPAPDISQAASLTDPYVVNADTLERGALLFEQNCSMCHGKLSQGNGYVGQKFVFAPHPPAFSSNQIQSLKPGEAYAAISNGFGAMPSFQGLLSEQDRWALVALIQLSEADRTALLKPLDNLQYTGAERVQKEIERQNELNALRAKQDTSP